MSLKRAIALLTAPASKSKSKAPKDPAIEAEARFSLQWLDAYGYFQHALDTWKDISLDDILQAFMTFQNFFGLKMVKARDAHGQIDRATIRAMQLPRCGCPDIQRDHLWKSPHAAGTLPAWTKRSLTYYIKDYVPGLSKSDVDVIVASAFNNWCQHGNVIVHPTTSSPQTADMVLSVGQGRSSNFDGPGGTLAWAYMPNGRDQQLLLEFDLDETWITSPQQRGILLANVACHEIGHLLGLDHSRVQGALMAPYYNQAIAVPQQNDDIPRFVARYGQRPTAPSAPPLPPANPPPAGHRLVVEFTGGMMTLDGRQLI